MSPLACAGRGPNLEAQLFSGLSMLPGCLPRGARQLNRNAADRADSGNDHTTCLLHAVDDWLRAMTDVAPATSDALSAARRAASGAIRRQVRACASERWTWQQ